MMKKIGLGALAGAGILALVLGMSETARAQVGRTVMSIRGLAASNGDSLVDDTANAVKGTLVDSSGAAVSLAVDATHDSVPSAWSGPLLHGYAASSAPTSVSAGDAVRGWFGLKGQLATMLVDSDGSAVSVGGGTQYDEDTASSEGEKLTMLGAVRRDSLPTTSSADGDRTNISVDESGRVYTRAAQYGQWTVRPTAVEEGGCVPGSIISAASVNETQIKATLGHLYSLTVTNVGASAVYLKLYNDTAANVDETDTPVQRFVIPGSTTGAGVVVNIPIGMAFSTAITFRITGAIADNDTTTISANTVLVSYCYY